MTEIAIIYHSESGNTADVAACIREGAEGAEGVSVSAMSVDSIDEEAANRACAVIVGCPTYAGCCSWQIKRWVDTTKLKLAGKIGAVYATENFLGGGADFSQMVVVSGLLVRGMLVYSGGTSHGKPFTHFGAVTIARGDDEQRERARIFGRRIADKALELFG